MAGQYPGDEYLEGGSGAIPPSYPIIAGIELTPIRIGLLIGGLGLLAAGVLAFTGVKPLLEEIDQVKQDIQTKNDELTKAKASIASLSNVETQIAQERDNSEKISSLLPTPDTIDTQLLNLQRLMKTSATNLLTFKPAAPVAAGPEVPAPIAPQIKVQTSTITMNGRYEDTIALMKNIERLRTLLSVNNLTVTPKNDKNKSLDSSFSLTAYIYDKNAVLPTPAPTPTPAASPTPQP